MNQDIINVAKALFTKLNHKAGLPQEIHTALILNTITDLVFTEFSEDAKDEAKKAWDAAPEDKELKAAYDQIVKVRSDVYSLIYMLANGSAVRQRLEADGVALLAKSESKKGGVNATALANKYA